MTSTTTTTKTKSKILTTNRVRLSLDRVIYVSSVVAREASPLCLRGHNNILIPKKGLREDLIETMKQQAKLRPTHFAKSSLIVLETL